MTLLYLSLCFTSFLVVEGDV